MNNENLEKYKFDSERAKECGRIGGIKSGETRRRKKELKEIALAILDLPLRSGEPEEFKSLAESKGKNLTTGEAIVLAQVNKALQGDTRAFESVRDTAGQKPTERQEIKAEVNNTGELENIFNLLEEYTNKNK